MRRCLNYAMRSQKTLQYGSEVHDMTSLADIPRQHTNEGPNWDAGHGFHYQLPPAGHGCPYHLWPNFAMGQFWINLFIIGPYRDLTDRRWTGSGLVDKLMIARWWQLAMVSMISVFILQNFRNLKYIFNILCVHIISTNRNEQKTWKSEQHTNRRSVNN